MAYNCVDGHAGKNYICNTNFSQLDLIACFWVLFYQDHCIKTFVYYEISTYQKVRAILEMLLSDFHEHL